MTPRNRMPFIHRSIPFAIKSPNSRLEVQPRASDGNLIAKASGCWRNPSNAVRRPALARGAEAGALPPRSGRGSAANQKIPHRPCQWLNRRRDLRVGIEKRLVPPQRFPLRNFRRIAHGSFASPHQVMTGTTAQKPDFCFAQVFENFARQVP